MITLANFSLGMSDSDARGTPTVRRNTTRLAARAMVEAATARQSANPPAIEDSMEEQRRSGEPSSWRELGFYKERGKGQGGESVTGHDGTNSAGATPQEGMPKPGNTFSGNSY